MGVDEHMAAAQAGRLVGGMGRYRSRPFEVEAVRWWENGDHPDDGPADREGRVVRYYRSPNVPSSATCSVCGERMLDHGWIDTIAPGGLTVCPGDWIVTGPNGEVYPMKPQPFIAAYEPV